MKDPAAVLSVLGLAGATLFVAWSSSYKPTDPTMTEEVVEPADFAPPPPPSRPGLADESMRDSVSAGGPSPMPIPIAGLSMTPKPSPAPSASRAFPAGERKTAQDGAFFARLAAGPESFFLQKTFLGSPADFRRFLADRRRVDAYLDSALVRAALRSPAVVRSILASGPIVRAFLNTPALQDPAVVGELLKSPLMRKLLDCPGVQEALSDPLVMARLVRDPATAAFVMDNPQVLKTLSAVIPALGRAFGR